MSYAYTHNWVVMREDGEAEVISAPVYVNATPAVELKELREAHSARLKMVMENLGKAIDYTQDSTIENIPYAGE